MIHRRLPAGAVLALALAALGSSFLSPSPQAQQPAAVAGAPGINSPPDPWLAGSRFRAVGPASMGGRIDDIAVSESDPNVIYLGYAVGGVFTSENNGTSFTPVVTPDTAQP